MNIIKISDELVFDLFTGGPKEIDNKYYKISPCSEGIITRISSESFKLDTENYQMPIDILCNQIGEYCGFTMQYSKDYDLLYKSVPNLTKNEIYHILYNVLKAYKDLKKIGVTFHDIHSRNILTNGNKQKLIDLDGVRPMVNEDTELSALYNMTGLAIEMFINAPDCIGLTVEKLFRKGIIDQTFKESTINYLTLLRCSDVKALDYGFPRFIDEISDDECVKQLRKLL